MDKIDTHAWKIKGPLYTVYSYDKRVYQNISLQRQYTYTSEFMKKY